MLVDCGHLTGKWPEPWMNVYTMYLFGTFLAKEFLRSRVIRIAKMCASPFYIYVYLNWFGGRCQGKYATLLYILMERVSNFVSQFEKKKHIRSEEGEKKTREKINKNRCVLISFEWALWIIDYYDVIYRFWLQGFFSYATQTNTNQTNKPNDWQFSIFKQNITPFFDIIFQNVSIISNMFFFRLKLSL